MEERPDELPADVLERELQVGVLERGVVAGGVDVPGEGVAPLAPPLALGRVGESVSGDVLHGDDPLRAVAGARGGGDAVERPCERADEADERKGERNGGTRRESKRSATGG